MNELFARVLGMSKKPVFKAGGSTAKKSEHASLDVTKGGLAHVFKNDKPMGIFHGSNAHSLRMSTDFKPS